MNAKVLSIIGAIIAVFALLVILSARGGDGTASLNQLSSNQWGEVSGDDQIFFIEGIDFECPACSQAHPIMKRLREDYSDRIVFVARHYPLRAIHLNAMYAHRAAEAAAKQGKFWEMHDLLFEKRDLWINQIGPDGRIAVRVDPVPAVEQFAQELGLDLEQLKVDLESTEVNRVINNDIGWVNEHDDDPSTPTFFIQRGVDGPVEHVPDGQIASLADAQALLDKVLEDAGISPETETDNGGQAPASDDEAEQPQAESETSS